MKEIWSKTKDLQSSLHKIVLYHYFEVSFVWKNYMGVGKVYYDVVEHKTMVTYNSVYLEKHSILGYTVQNEIKKWQTIPKKIINVGRRQVVKMIG